MYFQLVDNQALSTQGQPDVNLHRLTVCNHPAQGKPKHQHGGVEPLCRRRDEVFEHFVPLEEPPHLLPLNRNLGCKRNQHERGGDDDVDPPEALLAALAAAPAHAQVQPLRPRNLRALQLAI
eukprot:713066-Pyramimonas_sp.AAC.1